MTNTFQKSVGNRIFPPVRYGVSVVFIFWGTPMRFFVSFFVVAAVLFGSGVGYISASVDGVQGGQKTTASKTQYSSTAWGQILPPVWGDAVPKHLVVRPPAENYLPRTIIVKTRERFIVAPNAKGFPSIDMTQGFHALTIHSVRTPFEDFNNGAMAARDVHGIGRIYEVQYDAPVDAFDACVELSRNPMVEYAVPVYQRFVYETPDDPFLKNQYAITHIEAEKAWDIIKGKPEVLIAIIDSGIDYEHEDLAGNLWTNTKEIAGNGIDDDNNGKVDDVHGWDFVGNVSASEISFGQFREDNDPKVRVAGLAASDVRSHGTTVAGAAAAVANNGKGVAGIGYLCRYIPIKCGSDNASARGIYQGYEAILYAARLGAHIINCSWGGYGSNPAEQDVINQATDMGSLVVAASGNSGFFTDIVPVGHYPSSYNNVLSVGSTQSNSAVSDFSNYGARTVTYAPGNAIWTTHTDNRYTVSSGTSFSAPIVSGIAALVRAVHPDWTPMQILRQIRSTSDNVLQGVTTDNRYLYYGRANAYRAVSINQSFTAGQTIPGVATTTIDVEPGSGQNKLTTLEPTPVKIVLKNYLASASNVQVSVRSLDGYATFATSTFTLGTLGTLQEASLDLVVTLKSRVPWLDGSLDVLLTYKSGSYEDYERIALPVAVPGGNNQHTVFRYPLAPLEIQWNAISSPNANTCWAVGYQQGEASYAINSGTGFAIPFSTIPSYAVAGVSNSVAYAGVNQTNGGNAAVMKTVNGGQQWTSSSVSTITGFINALYFFDENEGILLGDPAGSKWGVGRTTDGGKTWLSVNVPASPIVGEGGLVRSSCQVGDNIWFGTTKGRVFYSANRGQNWQAYTVVNGAVVTAVSFSGPQRGIVLYRMGSDVSLPLLVATTTDGGKTWQTNVHNFADDGMRPVALYSPVNSVQTIVVGDNSEMYASMDDGSTWGPYRTRMMGTTIGAAGSVLGNRVRVWTIGASFGYVESDVPRERELSSSESSIGFGSVSVGSSATKTLVLTSTGIQPVTITALTIENGSASAGEYSVLSTALPFVLQPHESSEITLQFAPVKAGFRTASLHVESNAEPTTLSVNLSGFGISTVSVQEQEHSVVVQLHPNPVSEFLAVDITTPHSGVVSVELVSLLGTVVGSASVKGIAGEHLTTQISTHNLVSGVYFCRLLLPSGSTVVHSFIVQR